MTGLARIILWAWVVVAGILVGGGLYETVVLTPLWGGSPPESVLQWTHAIPQARFFGVVTPVYGLLSLALLGLSFRMPNSMRAFAMVAGAAGVVIVIWTVLFFIPILQQTKLIAELDSPAKRSRVSRPNLYRGTISDNSSWSSGGSLDCGPSA